MAFDVRIPSKPVDLPGFPQIWRSPLLDGSTGTSTFLRCRHYPVLGIDTDMRSQARVLGSFWFLDPYISRSHHKPYNTRSPPTYHSVLLQPIEESLQPPVICKFTSCTFPAEINITLNRNMF